MEEHPSLTILRLIAERLKDIRYPRLTRPKILPNETPTPELVSWSIQTYCFPWVRHFGVLISAVVTLSDSDNKAAVRIIGRSSFELCAHVYYVKKHLKQHIERGDFSAAYDFLGPIATGSRYMNEILPEESSLFPSAAHIQKAINCFKEAMPEGSEDDYSYLSEYCHPNMMAFSQHYEWVDRETIVFENTVPFGAFGAITSSAIMGLLSVDELLRIGNETRIRKSVVDLLIAITQQSKEQFGAQKAGL